MNVAALLERTGAWVVVASSQVRSGMLCLCSETQRGPISLVFTIFNEKPERGPILATGVLEYLGPIQQAIWRRVQEPGNQEFINALLVVVSKGLKLQRWKTPRWKATADQF